MHFLKIPDDCFLTHVHMRLGVVAPPPTPLRCVCAASDSDLKRFPLHLHCTKLKRRETTSRHDSKAEVKPSSFIFPGSVRPDVKFIAGLETYMVDVTVRDPLSPSYLQGGQAHTQGKVARIAETEKTDKYDVYCQQAAVFFLPIAFEAFGLCGWTTSAR